MFAGRGDHVTQTQDFFSPEAVGQLAGAIAAVTAISVTVRRLTGRNTPVFHITRAVSGRVESCGVPNALEM